MTYYHNIYDENLLEPIIKRAIQKANEYSMVVRLCKVKMPDRNNFMINGIYDEDDGKEWASLIIDAAPGVASIDVKNIEEWIIKEIIWYIDEEFVQLVNLCFALKCLCKVTDNQAEEVVRQWKEHSSYRMSHDDKKYIYTNGGRRKCISNSCDTFSKKYVWRARHLELQNFRGDFDILIGDKNGCLTKKMEKFSYPLHKWNELIEKMREENSAIWKK
jgi:hypothetical protein